MSLRHCSASSGAVQVCDHPILEFPVGRTALLPKSTWSTSYQWKASRYPRRLRFHIMLISQFTAHNEWYLPGVTKSLLRRVSRRENWVSPSHQIGIEFVQLTSGRDIRRPSTFDDEVAREKFKCVIWHVILSFAICWLFLSAGSMHVWIVIFVGQIRIIDNVR